MPRFFKIYPSAGSNVTRHAASVAVDDRASSQAAQHLLMKANSG